MSGSPGESLRTPPSINDLRTKSLSGIVQRLGTIDLSPILLYTIASAPDAALPFLAWQFDMLAPWWQIFADGASQRQLIQQAIALHRFKGTPFAVQSIVGHLGFGLVTIEEGQASWGGTSWPTDEGWAVFRVLISKARVTAAAEEPTGWDAVTNVDLLIDVDSLQQAQSIDGMEVPGALQSQLVSAISFFKPARCWLDSVWFREIPEVELPIAVWDSFTLSAGPNILEPMCSVRGEITMPATPLFDREQITPFYSAHFYHAGITYGASEPAVADSGIIINS